MTTPDPFAEAIRWSVATMLAFNEEQAGNGEMSALVAEHAPPDMDLGIALGALAYVALVLVGQLAQATGTSAGDVLHGLTLWAASLPDDPGQTATPPPE